MKNRMDCLKSPLNLASTLLLSASLIVFVALFSANGARRAAFAGSVAHLSAPEALPQGTPPQCVAPPIGMIAWWPGDGHPNDLAGNFNGTLTNGATYAPGKVLNAFRLDGVDDYVDMGTSSALAPPVLTVDFWMVPQATPTLVSHPVSRWGHSTQTPDSWQFGYLPNNKIYFTTRNVAGTQVTVGSTSTLPLNQWSHVAATYDGGAVRLYINGALESTAALNGPVRNNPSTTSIGCKITGGVCNYPFRGLVDEVEIFNRALTQAEIKAIFAAGSAGKCKDVSCVKPPCGMVGWWPGDAHPNSLVGSGLNGTLTNGASYAPGKVLQAFNFDGVNDYVDLGTSPLLAPNEITVDYWIYPRATNSPVAHPVARLGHTGTPLLDSWLFGFQPNQRMNFYVFSTTPAVGGVTSTTVLSLNQWNHVAGTYDGSTVKIYINGQLEAAAPFTGALRNNPSTTAVGCKVLAGTCIYPFNGMVDELEIFNRALSQVEINAIYHADRRGKCK